MGPNKQQHNKNMKLDLVWSPCTTSGQEMERVYSYNPGAHTWPPGGRLTEFHSCL